MKVYNEKTSLDLCPELKSLLENFRNKRNFNEDLWLQAKIAMINNYFTSFNIKTAIVAVSGGIDSALVLSLMKMASLEKDSSIEKVVPVLMPAFSTNGVTNQKEATEKGQLLCSQLKLDPVLLDLSDPFSSLSKAVEASAALTGEPWAKGQLVPYLRTPSLYYLASLYSENGSLAIICGTTNKDEGAYLGYFGKASDGLVDLQLISDLYKSEVYKVSSLLGVPREIMEAVPTGDMFDCRSDEEVFGASYDFTELYLNFLEQNDNRQKEIYDNLSTLAKDQFSKFAKNLENLHHYNRHKYLSHSAAIHLDLFPTKIKKGWKNNSTIRESDKEINKNAINSLNETIVFNKDSSGIKAHEKRFSGISTIKNLLSKKEADALLDQLEKGSWKEVNQNGFKKEDHHQGSKRQSFFSTDLSLTLYERLSPLLLPLKKDKNEYWHFSGVSNLFRAISYEGGEKLFPHYDAPYQFNEKKITMQSIIITLQEATAGGETRFIIDSIKESEKNDYLDWNREPSMKEINFLLKAAKGEAIIFDHRLLHDGAKVIKGKKIILRSDLIYEKYGI